VKRPFTTTDSETNELFLPDHPFYSKSAVVLSGSRILHLSLRVMVIRSKTHVEATPHFAPFRGMLGLNAGLKKPGKSVRNTFASWE